MNAKIGKWKNLPGIYPHLTAKGVEGINIPRAGLVGQPNRHGDFIGPFGDRDFKGFLFRPERLEAGIAQQPEFLVRSQSHDRAPAVAGLRHIEFRSFKEFLPIGGGSGHLQDHPGAGRSAVRDPVAGLIVDFGFDHGQGLMLSLVDLEEIPQSFHLQRQGLA